MRPSQLLASCMKMPLVEWPRRADVHMQPNQHPSSYDTRVLRRPRVKLLSIAWSQFQPPSFAGPTPNDVTRPCGERAFSYCGLGRTDLTLITELRRDILVVHDLESLHLLVHPHTPCLRISVTPASSCNAIILLTCGAHSSSVREPSSRGEHQ